MLAEALKAVEFRGQQGKCPLCAGWMMSAYGETPGKHTNNCLVGLALNAPVQASLTVDDVYANCETTLIGFSHELSEHNRKFICDQISRKVMLALTSTEGK